uniref:Glycosyltransferase 2-like domain-containing protein n=1 Tax=viral metagenome TaxID=1070528 RepID=A0A6C0HI54_9ZZZZ
MSSSLGFIILRHVNNEENSIYWKQCYECIRKFYPENQILIIDDNSDYQYIHVFNNQLYKTTVINSEFTKRGELLPFYYYLSYKLFDQAVIIHDSVFIQRYIDFSVENNGYKIFWDFEHDWNKPLEEEKMLHVFEDPDLIAFYRNKSMWKGCFGCMCIITHDFLVKMNSKYDISKLLGLVNSRKDRSSFERVIACLMQKTLHSPTTMYGNIHKYTQWSLTYAEISKARHLPMIKVWTGR